MNRKALILIALLLVSSMYIIDIAQGASLVYSISNTSVNIQNQYYQVTFNLTKGASIVSYNTLVPQTVQLNSLEVPSMVLSINQTLPGSLYNQQWKATLINKGANYVKILFTPTNSGNISIYEFVTVSTYYPYISYNIIVNATSNNSYIKDLYLGIGGIYLGNNWSFIGSELVNGIPKYFIGNASNSYTGNFLKVLMLSSSNNSYKSMVGLNFVTPTYASVQFLKGYLNGTPASNGVAYTIIDIKNISLARGNSYEISFNLYDSQFNPELISLTDSLDMVSQVYNISGNITNLINYNKVVNSYLSEITSLNQSVNSLTTKVGELQGLVSYWQVRYNETNQLAGSYSYRLHKSGEVSIGLFIIGLVIGVVGGAYFLKPKPSETIPVKQQKKETKKK
ncbi:hypothetical protein [Caldisphaera sp.]|uniref:hypothetical protein n=1 Tax=Caldisphaera sp. TaxID=2060322 RepID=UPI0025C51A04|nr:hypothetical protein [Caldisphaera sp.]